MLVTQTHPLFFQTLLLLLCASAALAAEPQMSLEQLTEVVKMLTSQIQLQQFQFQERIRSQGNSGIEQIRIRQSGTKNYNTENHIGRSIAAIHTHSNFERTVGLGEFIGVLNGVEFRTRHNDYSLVMPSTTSKDLHAVDNVPFPEVPPQVMAKKTVEEQAAELREFFKAWRDQNTTHRDYVNYFKPVLCYLEGAWFKVKPGGAIQESFQSDRHSLDASSWMQLHDRGQFMAYTGGKSRFENLAMLPTAFFGTVNSTIVPQLAQFNYRILCHPLKKDLPLKYLHPVEDFASRLFRNKPSTKTAHVNNRAARFALNSRRSGDIGGQYTNGLLDELMSEIPGKDNYAGKIVSNKNDDDAILSVDDREPINQAYYHRYYQLNGKDAMGLNLVHRSYSDDFGFAAQTTQESIAGLDYTAKCKWVKCKVGTDGCGSKGKKKSCPSKHEKWSWAFPLEIIYLTPLHAWNPHNIVFKEGEKQEEVTASGRNGKCDSAKTAYNGANRKVYYRTPLEFFSQGSKAGDKADTIRQFVCALNQAKKSVKVAASGVFIISPEIQGVGKLRLRYPIMPVHGEGSSTWKELNALRQLVMNKEEMKDLVWKEQKVSGGITLKTLPSTGQSRHTHQMSVSKEDYTKLKDGNFVTIVTEQVQGHNHVLKMRLLKEKFKYIKCDGAKSCFDGHPANLEVITV